MRIGKHQIVGNKVTISEVELVDARLVEALEGLSESEQSDFLLSAMRFATQLVVQAHGKSEVREIESALEKTQELFEEGSEDFKKQFLATLNGQLDEGNHGSLISLLRSRLVDALVKSLMPSNENSPLHEIKVDLQELLKQTSEQKGLKKGKAKSGIKGQDFEILVHQLIADESVIHGESAEFTGDTPTATNEKAGDTVVTFDQKPGEEFKVVWECKTEASFKSAKGLLLQRPVRAELQKALLNREADCAIFVADSAGLDLQPEWQVLDSNKLMIVLNSEEPDQRLVRLAYLWSKSVAAQGEALDMEIDFLEIERGLGDLEAAIGSYKALKAAHTAIESGLTQARGVVENQEREIVGALTRVKEAIDRSSNSDDQ